MILPQRSRHLDQRYGDAVDQDPQSGLTSPLISAEHLRRRLRRGPTASTVLDVRYRVGAAFGLDAYAAGHVPGAAFVDLDADLADPPSSPVDERGRHPLPTPDAFIEAMRRAGVSRRIPVVVYDDWEGRAASRAWWLLRHYGHSDVRVLDGGWTAWVTAGGGAESGRPRQLRGDFDGSPGTMATVETDSLLAVPVVVDARATYRYRGESEPLDPVAGHVPGAVNVETDRNLTDDGHFRDAAHLRDLYEGAGALPGTGVAAYCGSGVTATHDILAMEVAGISAALFAPSWSGWVADPDRPVERG